MEAEKLKALIVDDEIFSVRAIKSSVGWNKLGFDEVLSAFDVKHARDICLNNRIDLIISDIEMPNESGLSLLKWIKTQNMDIAFIFLTCHEDFAYAKEAIELDSWGYLVKPIDYRILETEISKNVNKLLLKRRTDEESKLAVYWKNNSKIVYREWWKKIICSEDSVKWNQVIEEAEKINLQICVEREYHLVLFRPKRINADLKTFSYNKALNAVLNYLTELFHENNILESSFRTDTLVTIICKGKEDNAVISSIIGRSKEECKTLFHIDIQTARGEQVFFEELRQQFICLSKKLLLESEKNVPNTIINQVNSYIQDHITETIFRDTIAEYVHLHPDYLNRLVKKETGLTITEYILREKITKAETLLISSDLAIGEVAFEVGIANFSYFSNLFKKQTGYTPKEYRHMNKSRL